jgi:predicted ArsR family transcriptional regulator
MANGSHFTLLTLRVGKLFIAERHKRHFNQEIAMRLDTEPPNTHGILKEFEANGWIKASTYCEGFSNGRPRKMYGVTEMGIEALSAVLMPLQLASS